MKQWLRRPIVWLPVSGLLLAFVAWRSGVWRAGEVLGTPDPVPLAAAILLNGVIVVLWAVRTAVLLATSGHPVGVGQMLPMGAFANTVNNVTPGSTGEVARAWLLRARHAVPYATGTAVILIERLVAIAYMGLSAIIAWVGYAVGLPAPVAIALLLVVAATPGLVYAAGLRPAAALGGLAVGVIPGEARRDGLRAAVARVDETMATILTSPRPLTAFAVTTALVFTCYTLQLWLVAASVGISIDPVAAWGALGLATVAGVISLLPFGLGATDLVLAGLLATLGVPPPAAAAIAFGYRLVATLPLGLLGAASYAWLSSKLPAGGTEALLAQVRAGDAGPAGETAAQAPAEPPA